jgi:hypothetical protein
MQWIDGLMTGSLNRCMSVRMKEEYDFYMTMDLTPYPGEWIAICGREVIAHAKSFGEAYDRAISICGVKRPLMAKVHANDEYLML